MLLSQLSRTSNVGVVDQHPAYRMIISKKKKKKKNDFPVPCCTLR
jgi:hypothetical protein